MSDGKTWATLRATRFRASHHAPAGHGRSGFNQALLRWFDELLHPAKKCGRLGHLMTNRETHVYLYPPQSRWRAVADRAVELNERCGRCGFETEPTVAKRSSLQGLSMPSDRWDTLRETGRLVR